MSASKPLGPLGPERLGEEVAGVLWAARGPGDPEPTPTAASPQRATWSGRTAHHCGLGLQVPLMLDPPPHPVHLWLGEAAWCEKDRGPRTETLASTVLYLSGLRGP